MVAQGDTVAHLSESPNARRLSLTHRLEEDPLWPLSIPLAVEDALPGAEVEPARGDGDDDLVMNEQGLQVRIPVVFAGVVMFVVFAEGCQLLQPLIDVFDQPTLVVIHIDAGRDVHGRNQHHAFLDAALAQDLLHLGRDVDVGGWECVWNFKYSVRHFMVRPLNSSCMADQFRR